MIRFLVLALLSGCATMVDVAYLIGGPNTSGGYHSTSHGTGRIEHRREVAIAPGGLVCRDIETPFVTGSSVSGRQRHPNGYKLPMQVATMFEATITGIIVGAIELNCATSPDECTANRDTKYLYALPVFADIAWGIFRSLTIRNEIVKESTVTYRGDETPVQGTTLASSCPAGTEIPLYADADSLVVRVGTDGAVVDTDLELLLRFVIAHPQFSVGGGLAFDTDGIAGLVSYARAKYPPVVVREHREPVSPPPPTTPPTTIEVPSQVCIETPYADACIRARPPVRDHR